ncbi:unnamed protein product, partial [marine sediment metagenome]
MTLFCDKDNVDNTSKQGWTISKRGIINVFEYGLTNDDGDIINCETSAIAYDGKNLIMGSDK